MPLSREQLRHELKRFATREELLRRFATKEELLQVRDALRQEMGDLRTELKEDMSSLRAELERAMDSLGTRLRSEMAGWHRRIVGDVERRTRVLFEDQYAQIKALLEGVARQSDVERLEKRVQRLEQP